ncbi:MAG: hypothetical protein Q9224_004679 [Gallowayella concinna]
MLPDFLAGSYKRYKQDTTLFTTWLAKAAASAGYKPNATKQSPSQQPEPSKATSIQSALPTGGRLKGKARKAAKDAAEKVKNAHAHAEESQHPSTVKYTITTGELLRQAEAVAQSYLKSHLKMPASLRVVVERAVRARQRCSEWFQKSGVHNEYADKQHIHFIRVLEQSLKILEPCVEAEDANQGHPYQNGTSSEPSTSLTNPFSLLKMEDSPELDPAQVSEVAAAVSVPEKTKASKGEPEIAVYELEDEDEFDEELAFVIFCFFEDLHRTQDFINHMWRKYKTKKCDLHTAAITTNAAFELVRQAEEDLIAQAPAVFDRKRSYDSIAIIVFYADAFQQGTCPEARLQSNESLRVTPFDDFIYLSTARILMKFTFMANLPKGYDFPWPAPCPPLRFSYISRPDLLGTPEMDRKEQEDGTLSKLIIDRQLWNTYKKEMTPRFSPPPSEDELSESLDRLTKEGVLSVALVFEARIFLDIQEIMGEDIGRGHQDLLRDTEIIDKIMNLKAVNGAWDVGGTGERWHERDVDVVMRIKQTSIYWILDAPTNAFPQFKEFQLNSIPSDHHQPLQSSRQDAPPQHGPPPQQAHRSERPLPERTRVSPAMPPKNPKLTNLSMKCHRVPEGVDVQDPEFQRLIRQQLVEEGALPDDEPVDPQYEENARKLNIKMIQPSKDLNYLFTTNPIYCGLVSFNLLTDFEAAGISLCNWHKSIWPTAHLYNALQQTSSISKSWPEMDELIDLHMNPLFADHVPLSAHEFYVRFALALGLSMTSISRNPRNRTNNDRVRFRQGANGIKLKVTEISRVFRQYFDKKSSLEVCLLKLDCLFRDPGVRASRKEREASKRPLTNLQFLAMLEGNLPQVTQRLRFDYVTLTKQCVKLLKNTRLQIALQYQVFYPSIPTEDSADQTLTWVIMQILEENNDIASSQPGAQNLMVGPQLGVAGQEMQKFLGTYSPQDLISNFNALPRPPRTPSGLVPNHWNISIRHVALSPPGDLVFLVQPDSHYVHTEGPIQTVEGQTRGHVLNPKSLVTLQTIARLIMKAFVEGMGAGSAASFSAPWSWKTNDPNFARRIIKVMTDMGVREDLMTMEVADSDELASCDEDWNSLRDNITRHVTEG